MTRLNRDAAEALHEIDDAAAASAKPVTPLPTLPASASSATRAKWPSAAASPCIDHARIAYLPGAIEAARGGFFSGGLNNNRDFVESCAEFALCPRGISLASLRSATPAACSRRSRPKPSLRLSPHSSAATFPRASSAKSSPSARLSSKSRKPSVAGQFSILRLSGPGAALRETRRDVLRLSTIT